VAEPFLRLYNSRLDWYLKLEPRVFKVLVCLLRHENRTTGLCCPSYETIKAETLLRRETIADALRVLEWLKIISTTHKTLKRGRYYNTYKVHTPDLSKVHHADLRRACIKSGRADCNQKKDIKRRKREPEVEYYHEGTSTDDEIEWDD